MKFILRSATMASVLALGMMGAHAADLAYEPVPVAAPEVFNWTGFYIGVHGGIGGGNFDGSFLTNGHFHGEDEFHQQGVDSSDNAFGAFGGVQAGYNYQFAPNWVAGVEADIAASGIAAKHDANYFDLYDGVSDDNGSIHTEAKIDWFGTIRGRLGYAWDNLLIYGTGGAAYGSVKVSGSDDYNSDFDSFSQSDTKWGWTAGAGFEYGITKNVTLKTEYLYVDLGSVDVGNIGYDGGEGAHASFDTAFHTLKAGLNYKF